MNDELDWETLDLDAPWPKVACRATVDMGSWKRDIEIRHYIPTRDKKWDHGCNEMWAFSNGQIADYGFFSLDAAKAAAEEWEQHHPWMTKR
jgi:hypothetical protein